MTAHLPLSRLVLVAEESGGGLTSFLPFVIVFVIFYLLVFRPSSKERKTREAQVKSLKKHDRVVTNAGIHGVVVGLEADAVILRVDEKNNVRIRFSRAAIWQVNAEAAATPNALPETEPEPQETASK